MIHEHISKACVDFATHFSLETAPPQVREHVKKCLLDWLGCAIRGAVTTQAKCIRQYVHLQGGNEHASFIGSPVKTSMYNAALGNGYFGHILEMDDVDKESITHPGTVVISAALSIGEWNRRSGRELLAAIITGYEVMLRVGASVTPGHYQIWHTTATSGVFGSTLAAGRMIGLNAEQMGWAFGNAGSTAAGLWEFLHDGAMSKYLHAGRAAASGVMVASLAMNGFTGASRILEGEQGFFAGYARQAVDYSLFEDFGDNFRASRVSFKPYPCCRHTHAAIDCARALAPLLIGRLHDVGNIEVSTYKSAVQVAGIEQPADSRQAQFSLKYIVARALKSGHIGLEDFSEDVLCEADTRQLMDKSSILIDPDIDRLTPSAWPTRVTVRFNDGEKVEKYVEYPKGDPENPLTWEEVKAKFTLLTGGILQPDSVKKIIDLCENLEQVHDCGDIIRSVNFNGQLGDYV